MIVIITLLLRFLLLAIMTPTQGLPALRGAHGTCASCRAGGEPGRGGWRWAGQWAGQAHLGDEELGEALRQPALLAGEDHLQHVPVQLLHHHKYLLRGLEHTLQVDNPRVPQTLGWVGWERGRGSEPRSPANLRP